MNEILLIRHGQASAGSADYDQLSPLGVEQSRLLGLWMTECGRLPDAVISGRRRRQIGTARAVIEAMSLDRDVEIDPAFDEFDHREVLLRHRPDLAEQDALLRELASPDNRRILFTAAIGRWVSGAHDDYGESWEAFRARVRGGIDALGARGSRSIWVFTSAGPVSAAVGYVLEMPSERTAELATSVMNGAVTRLVWRDGWRLSSFNATPHLERAGPGFLTAL